MQYSPLTLIFILLFITSCGFKPVYRLEDNSTRQMMSGIEIESISSIEGAEYYNHLKKILPPHGKIKYIISTSLNFSKDFSLIQKNSDILRETITVRASYKLKEIETGKILTSGRFTRLSSFNTTFSPYSNQIKQQDVLSNLAVMAAEEVRTRVMLFVENTSKQPWKD